MKQILPVILISMLISCSTIETVPTVPTVSTVSTVSIVPRPKIEATQVVKYSDCEIKVYTKFENVEEILVTTIPPI